MDGAGEKSLVSLSSSLTDRVKRHKMHKLLFILLSLQASSKRVSRYAPEYDYDYIPFNGYRSFLRIIQLFLHQLEGLLMACDYDDSLDQASFDCAVALEPVINAFSKYRAISASERTKVLTDMIACGEFFEKQFKILESVRVRDVEMKTAPLSQLQELGNNIFVHPFERELVTNLLKVRTREVLPLFNRHVRNFQLHETSRQRIDTHLMACLLFNLPLMGKIRFLIDHRFRALAGANQSVNATASQVTQIFTCLDSRLFQLAMNWWRLGKPFHQETIRVSRQKRFGFLVDGSLHTGAHEYPGLPGQLETPEDGILLYWEKKCPQEDKLIFYCHGGGFVSTCANSHQYYLAHICQNVQVPIYTPGYTKAVNKPFPYALQDLLDAYLHVTGDEARDTLGFTPKNIIIAGDSAGGHLALVLTLILNELSRKNKNIVMPKAVHLFYPVSSCFVRVTPSRTLGTFDSILNSATFAAVAMAYSHKSDPPVDVKLLRDEKGFDFHYTKHLSRASNPFYNPCVYQRFFEMKHISLFIQCGEFDPLLDDSIEIARVWRGPVKLQILENHSHAYLTMNDTNTFKIYLETLYEMVKSVFESNGEKSC